MKEDEAIFGNKVVSLTDASTFDLLNYLVLSAKLKGKIKTKDGTLQFDYWPFFKELLRRSEEGKK